MLEALEAGAITKREAISMRSNQIASEHKYLAEDAKRDAQENSQPMPAYQPASSSTPIYLPAPVSPSQPKSVTCQPRDIFGKVKCDFE